MASKRWANRLKKFIFFQHCSWDLYEVIQYTLSQRQPRGWAAVKRLGHVKGHTRGDTFMSVRTVYVKLVI